MDSQLLPDTSDAVDLAAPEVIAEGPSHPGAVNIDGRLMLPNNRGGFDALTMIDAVDLLQDQTVKSIIGYAEALSAQIARFKGHTFDDINSFLDLIAEKYGAKRGGKKGNLTLTSYDGCMKVELKVADRIVFGPQLQVARSLVDECIASWSDGARDEIRALVDGAFNTDKEGTVDRTALLKLRRLNINNPVWKRAMEALGDSIRTEGTTTYMRFSRRPDVNALWTSISIDLAGVQAATAASPSR